MLAVWNLHNDGRDAFPRHPFLPCDLVAFPAYQVVVLLLLLLHRVLVVALVDGLVPYLDTRMDNLHDVVEADVPDTVVDIRGEDMVVVGTSRDLHTWEEVVPLVVPPVVRIVVAVPTVHLRVVEDSQPHDPLVVDEGSEIVGEEAVVPGILLVALHAVVPNAVAAAAGHPLHLLVRNQAEDGVHQSLEEGQNEDHDDSGAVAVVRVHCGRVVRVVQGADQGHYRHHSHHWQEELSLEQSQ
mmetsp:Transcript_7688/g.10972  ORF Transcript_7688/g.10972 Transcript_7688/m.10972 type:complete len:240 (-) Transcript_7688:453-1172(-)